MTHRILQIVPSLQRGGAQKSLAQLATQLPPGEFEVYVAALAGGPVEAELKQAGIPTTVFEQRRSLDPFVAWKLKQFIARLRPDIVQTWNFSAGAHGRAAAVFAGVNRLVASETCLDPRRPWHHRTIDRRLARRTDRVVVPTTAVRDFYVDQLGFDQSTAATKFSIVPGGIASPSQPAKLQTDPLTDDESRTALLEELGLPAEARLIGAVGTLAARKHLRDPIWSADLLKVIRGDVHFLIIGDGPQRKALERFRDNIEIADRVHFLGHREDVPRLLTHLDLLWHASGYEGLPYAIMEAMAAGLPVVATDISGNRELVVAEETGYLVSVGDRAGLARYANKLLDDDALRSQMGAAAKARIGSQFTANAMIGAYSALYRELLGN